MVKRQKSGWRLKVLVGVLTGAGALAPVTVLAQGQPGPSGAAVEVGGVTSRPSTSGGAVSAGGQARPVVLPNTGGGPAEDSPLGLALVALGGVMTLGTATYLRHRLWRGRIGG